MSAKSNYPSTRATRRAAFRTIRQQLTGSTPQETVAKVRRAMEEYSGSPRRPSDAAGGIGTWLPAFEFSAFAAALRQAERAMRAKS